MSWYRIEQNDAVMALWKMPEQSVDIIVTDPAYESLEKHRAVGTTTRLTKAWFPIFPNARLGELLLAMFRVLKASGHLYLLCDDETSYAVRPAGEAALLKYWQRIPWDKRRTEADAGMGYHWRNIFEYALFFEKAPGKQLNDRSKPNLLKHPRVIGGYPTEKPVGLWRDLIANSSQPGDVVLDPFCGSGSSGEAALELGRNYVGIDIADEAMVATAKRLEGRGEEVEQPPRPELKLELAR